jgi:hypothetical protein
MDNPLSSPATLDHYLKLADAYLNARRNGQDFSLHDFLNGGMSNDVVGGGAVPAGLAAPAGVGQESVPAPVEAPQAEAPVPQEAELTPATPELPPEAAEAIAAAAQQEAAPEPAGPVVVATGFKTKKAAMNALKKLGPGHSIVRDGEALAIVSEAQPVAEAPPVP